MVVMQILFDSLSRCFGIPLDPNDPHSHHHTNHHQRHQSSNNIGSQPLGASKSRSQSRDQHQVQDQTPHNSQQAQNELSQNGQSTGSSKDAKYHDSQWDVTQQGSTCCYSSTANPLEDEQVPAKGFKREMFSRAQMQALNGRQRHRSSTSSSSSQKDVMRKARKESTKRKLDIFRSDQCHKKSTSSSSFARLLGTDSSFPSGAAILCFANPIFDSEDDDLRIYRDDNDRDGEDTINSTLYFDAKYEHVIENRPPMPLYQEQSIMFESNSDEIIKLFESGCIKHEIKSIYCHKNAAMPNLQQQPVPLAQLKPGPRSMADSFSDAEDGFVEKSRHDMYVKNTQLTQNQQRQYKTYPEFVASSSRVSSIPSPPSVTKSRQELDVISDWVFSKNQSGEEGKQESEPPQSEASPPSLKLMNNSSLSTQALTPTNSASDTHLSPKKVTCTYYDNEQINENEAVEEI